LNGKVSLLSKIFLLRGRQRKITVRRKVRSKLGKILKKSWAILRVKKSSESRILIYYK
jgi:hypothetical protein